MTISLFDTVEKVENVVGKGENAGLVFTKLFSRTLFVFFSKISK